jgi:serine/threonine protein kinase
MHQPRLPSFLCVLFTLLHLNYLLLSQSEAAILRALSHQHPGLMKSHASFFNENVLWVVADLQSWMEGNARDLMSIVSPSGIEETLIRAICAQLLSPLEVLHKSGRLFRDMKAKNIMLLETGDVQIQTFTLPSILQDKAPMYRDSLYWVAPEILPNLETKTASPAADVWALGITVLELALGQPPMATQDLSPQQILTAISDGPAPGLTAEQKKLFSKAFVDVIGSFFSVIPFSHHLNPAADICLQKNPAKRATIEQLKDHPWFKNAPKSDFTVESLLLKLPEFHERVKIFLQNAASIAAKEMRAPQDGAVQQGAPGSGASKIASPPPGLATPTAGSPAPTHVTTPPVSASPGVPSGSSAASTNVAHPQPQHSGVHSLVQPLSAASIAAMSQAGASASAPPPSQTPPTALPTSVAATPSRVQSPPPSAASAPPNTPAGYNIHSMIATSPPVVNVAPIHKSAESQPVPTSSLPPTSRGNPIAAHLAVPVEDVNSNSEGPTPNPSPSRGRQRLSGGRSHRRRRSETDDIMDQIEQVALEESDGSDGEFDELENIGEESDDSDDESHGSLTEELSHRSLGIAVNPSARSGSATAASGTSNPLQVSGQLEAPPTVSASPGPVSTPLASSFTQASQSQAMPASTHVPVVLGNAPIQVPVAASQPPQPSLGSISHTKQAATVSPPQVAQSTSQRVPTSLTPAAAAGLQQSFSMAAVTGPQLPRDPNQATPSSTPADSPLESPTSSDQWAHTQQLMAHSSAATPTTTNGPVNPLSTNSSAGGEVRGRFRIVNNANPASGDGAGASAAVPPLTLAPLATNPPNQPGFEISDSIPVQQTAVGVISDMHQRPLHNIPLDTYVGETEREFLIFIRTIPGTTVRCRLEGKTLVIAGTLPSLPPIPGIKSVALFEKPHSDFVRKIKFLQEIDPSEPSRDMLREHNTMVIHIKKFPKVLDLCEDTF